MGDCPHRLAKVICCVLKDAGVKVKAFSANVGQPDEKAINDIRKKMAPTGVETTIVDVTKEIADICFETVVHHELRAYLDARTRDGVINYWRTRAGTEVDFVVGNIAIEAKGRRLVDQRDLKGLMRPCRMLGLGYVCAVISADCEKRLPCRLPSPPRLCYHLHNNGKGG